MGFEKNPYRREKSFASVTGVAEIHTYMKQVFEPGWDMIMTDYVCLDGGIYAKL